MAGRFYGLANNAVVTYGAAGILCAAWLGGTALRAGSRGLGRHRDGGGRHRGRRRGGVARFRAKVGGTIAMVPGFLVLLAAAAGVRLTARRWALVAISGMVLVTAFALINYFVPRRVTRTSGTSWGRCCTAAPGPPCSGR